MRPHEQRLLVANVVAMRSSQVGDYIYRVSQPSLALGRLPGVQVVTLATVSPYLGEVAARADLLILHLLTEDDLFPLVAERRRRGRPTVYEVSDHFTAMHEGVGTRGWFTDPLNRSNAFQLLRAADAAQVTGEGLREAFGAAQPRMAVFENQIERMGRAPRPQGASVRVGWAGSVGHTDDLRRIQPVIADLCARSRGVTFAFMGNRRQYDEVFGGLPSSQRSFTPPGTLDAYYAFLEQLDVGLAPMNDNPYNQCRSDVKFLEYASRGAVPVLSALRPYLAHAVHGETAFLYRDEAELRVHLGRLVAEPDLRTAVAQRAYDYVAGHRLEALHASSRLRFYTELGARPSDPLLPPLLQSVKLLRLRDRSEAYDVRSTPAERHLVAGIELESCGATKEARALFRRARGEAPGYDLPDFWLGRSHELKGESAPAAEAYAMALQLNPRSLRAALHLARLQAVRDPNRALATLEGAVAFAPTHAPTLEAMGRLHEALGATDRAIALYQAALEASPELSRVATRLGQLYDALGETAEAARRFEQAALLAPDSADAQLEWAEFLLVSGEIDRAAQLCIRAVELDRRHVRARALLGRMISAMERRQGRVA
jgi:tetratricopeptide (TPR) repeat protein